MMRGRFEKQGRRLVWVDATTKADREKHAGWTTPYATDPTCDHARGAVEVTPPFEQPPVDWTKPLGGFVIRLREWACADCGHPVNPHSYREAQLQPLPDEVRRASVTQRHPLSTPSTTAA